MDLLRVEAVPYACAARHRPLRTGRVGDYATLAANCIDVFFSRGLVRFASQVINFFFIILRTVPDEHTIEAKHL
jgi:hypothetical protein